MSITGNCKGLRLSSRNALRVELPASFTELEARVIVDDGERRSELPCGTSWAFRRQAGAFVPDIAGHLPPLASGADSVADILLAEAIWKRHVDQLKS